MIGLLSRLAEKRTAGYQNELMKAHYEEVQNIYRQIRGWRHDYSNHLQVIRTHVAQGQFSSLETYLKELDNDLTSLDTIIKSGNMTLDAILNSKLSLASAKKIKINVKAAAPAVMQISDTDLCVIAGNLLDNAIEACLKIEDEDSRFIRVYIGTFKEQFYISISNSTDEKVRKPDSRYFSTKRTGGGFGLMRIDRVVKKYGGYISRQNETGIFATEIMLPL